ncbi:hypothetical protein [Metabacillus sp. Hm71]
MIALINRYKTDEEYRKETHIILKGLVGVAIIILPLLYLGTLIGYLHT